jgi:hypothetical protein
MANSKDQNEPKVPTSNVEKRESSNLLPRFYRTSGNKKFLQATVDQLTQSGTVKKINGYVGRETAKAVKYNDIFLAATDKDRQDYQLEPAAVIEDYLGNTTFFKDYIDHMNHVEVFDGNTSNHSRVNKQEFYSWNPHICWDKFVNYQQYYWLPLGPDPLEIFGQQKSVESTYSVVGVDEEDNVAYLFTPNGLTRNPTLKLYRGQTYKFDIDAFGHPFSIKTSRTEGTVDRYNTGVSENAVEKGSIAFTVPVNAPDALFYVSENSADTGGTFQILDVTENTFLDIETDILGKKTYKIANGTATGLSLSNGMKLRFGGQVSPEIYSKGFWYVEGVGTAIRLISERELEVRSTYIDEKTIMFDDLPFDQLPFSETGTYPGTKDYITINRASLDNNPWSRYNRWFHVDVINVSAELNGRSAELSQTARATRPIIEFNPDIKLYNYGIKAKKQIDVIDNFTKDAFSVVEGSLGYSVDGIDLVDGMRIIFNAEDDILVRAKTYKVNFISVKPNNRQITFSATSVDTLYDTIKFDTPHGLTSGSRVYYLNNGNDAVPGLTNGAVYYVNNVDSLTVALYTDANLTKKVDITEVGVDTHKLEVYSGTSRQIHLTEELDFEPSEFETASVRYGTKEKLTTTLVGNQGQTYWFDGQTWKLGQIKTSVNQPPLFDVFDSNGVSYSDPSGLTYDGSTFAGTKIFSYKQGIGTTDTVLGFPLTYQNISNIGDIVFEFNLLTDSFAYKNVTDVLHKGTNVGYLKVSQDLERFDFENGWVITSIANSQPIIRVFRDHAFDGQTVPFPVDVFDNKDDLADLEVRVYVNNKRIAKSNFTVADGASKKYVYLQTAVTSSDVVILKCFAKQPKNENGYYELTNSLQNNPLNVNLEKFTLGEVVDHVDSIIDNISGFNGTYPGDSNLRDIGRLSHYGTRFVQHSGPAVLSMYHFGSKSANVVKALDQARTDYGIFKRSFLIAATNIGMDASPKRLVDYVLQEVVKDRPKTSPYYLSDMFGYTASNRIEYVVLDGRIKSYPLSEKFSLSTLSNKAVNIYLNDNQLVHGKDYMFGDDVFFTVLADLQENDIIEVYEYTTTDGCFCPATPTKLGLYPKFEPKKFIDNTYADPVEVIQGHDGSITIAFGDYRDDLLLELETRIFNNIKVDYNPDIFDIHDFLPGYNRTSIYSKQEFDQVMAKYFFQWTSNVQDDYTKHTYFDSANPFTYNYRGTYSLDGNPVPASWRGIYNWLLDTDRPHTHPWESLGFSIEPTWWQDVYGPAPYTSDNMVMWDDIRDGNIKETGKPVRKTYRFAKPVLAHGVPVDDQGNLLSPMETGLIQGSVLPSDGGYFVFGDQAPVEAAWRRSSYYPFAFLETCLLLAPNHVLGRCLDRSRTVRNSCGQLVYTETNLRISPSDILVPSTSASADRIYTAGLINYIVDFLSSANTTRIANYESDLQNLTVKLSTRLGAFTNKPKYKLLLDSKTPNTSGGVFVPEENYKIDLNVSSAIRKVSYSGIVITKISDGFDVQGYNFDNPYFVCYDGRQVDRVIRIGGVSESYIEWAEGKLYVAGKIIKNGNAYYRVKTTHTSSSTFQAEFYTKLAELPVIGGREATLRKSFNSKDRKVYAYGTKFETIQEVVDFIQGYGAYLEDQGFVFDDFNPSINLISNWETSIKEFLFWTTQNWTDGAVLSLSPSAYRIVFNAPTAVVEDVTDQFYGYNIFRVDGQKLDPEFIDVYRSGGQFVLEPNDTNYGVYGVTLHLVQKEHIALLDNTTLFNDTIYDQAAGYRQERIKVLGYVTSEWTGGFEIPGFIYDRAVINAWEPWTDYNLGDIVKHKEFYYSAKSFLVGVQEFDDSNWVLLDSKPKSELLPNLDYKAEQFTDFYDLDTDNLDAEQQKVAQHLIGYQKRQYLENIINNDVSQYKFYQGMIAEKGTQNVLNKLFDVLSAADSESLTFDEEWAFRVGEYGAVDTFDEVEFVLDESQFKVKPQSVELVDSIDVNATDFVYRIRPSDVYVKPLGYSNNLWQTKSTKDFLRTAGYVRKDEVKTNVNTLDDLLSVDISNFVSGDYIWTAFENPSKYWNVYRFTTSSYLIENVTYANGVVTVTTNKAPEGILDGSLIGIDVSYNGNATLKGFHKVLSVLPRGFTFAKTLPAFTFDGDALMYQLVPARVDTGIDTLNENLLAKIKPNELVWVDTKGEDWAVYKNSKVYTNTAFGAFEPSNNLNFGKSITISANGNLSVVADASTVTVYQKTSSDNNWASLQTFTKDEAEDFGSTVKLSLDGQWLAIVDKNNEVYFYAKDSTGLFNDYIELEEPTPISTIPAPNASVDFGAKVEFGRTDDNYFVAIADTNAVRVYKNVGATWEQVAEIAANVSDIAMSADASKLLVSSTTTGGKVEVYKLTQSTYTKVDTILIPTDDLADDEQFGQAVAISPRGNYVAVSATLKNITAAVIDVGQVFVYTLKDNTHSHLQTISSRANEVNEQFGYIVKFMNDETLVVFSKTGNVSGFTSFDDLATTFDNNSLSFVSTSEDRGRIDVYDRYANNFIYGETLENVSSQYSSYGYNIVVGNNCILVAAKNEDSEFVNAGAVYSYTKPSTTFSWTPIRQETAKVDISKIKKAFLYDKISNKLITYLDVVDPIQGKIPGIADQEIKFKTYFDPATYSVGTDVVNVDTGLNWTTSQVGMLWWDLTKAKFLDYQSGDTSYKNSTWNTLYDTASIDVYEWVESTLKPADWNSQADTEAGLTKGISGQSKYGNNVYSVKERYDSVSKTFKPTYYFWVKNKKVTPDVEGRKLSAYYVAQLIADPAGNGYSCLALTGSSSFSLVNLEKYLENKNIVLNVQYWLSDIKTSNFHSEWKLLSLNKNTSIPKALEDKWFHSLTGKDDNDRVVPDANLPLKQRYGIEFRPRQSMFVNRLEALKQFIERTNNVLSTSLITDSVDLTKLAEAEPAPSQISGEWDSDIGTEAELRFVSTVLLSNATVSPVVDSNGRLTQVDVVTPGYGYGKARVFQVNESNDAVLWYGPKVNISGTGVDAEAQTIVDALGKVVQVEVLSQGKGYVSEKTFATVRGHSVLVRDSFDGWAIFELNIASNTWARTKTQSYDVSKYWEYVDWYATGYSQFVKVDYLVENTYELVTQDIPVGSIVKVNNIGSGGWVLLEKFDNVQTIDYTLNYSVIGRQRGTIKFLPTLYGQSVGYDAFLNDSEFFDFYPTTELKVVLDVIKTNILVDDLRVEYLKLFFASVRYALTEQAFVDWAFKTSFVKSMHNVGELVQKVTYNSDNLEYFESYINEVKPYRTKVREYVSNYTKIENTQTAVTDFDLLPVIDDSFAVTPMSVKVSDTGVVTTDFAEINSYPWKFWSDEVGFKITSIKLVDSGYGYVSRPIVKIEGTQLPGGTPASAKAYISNGKVTRIDLIDSGTRWIKAPTITMFGGLNTDVDAQSQHAVAVAIIGDSVVRSNYVKVKFDRISKTAQVATLLETEEFSGTFVSGSKTQFALKWSPQIAKGNTYVTVNGIEVLDSEYTLSTVTSVTDGYTKYTGLLKFATAPAAGSVISIEYTKNFEHLSAVDRINFYYNPQTGQFGKDASQLMTGVDYGGVSILGSDFHVNAGWDSFPWFADVWDSVDPDFEDYIVTVGADAEYQYKMPFVPEVNQNINIYISRYTVSPTYVIESVEIRSVSEKRVRIVLTEEHNLVVGQSVTISDVDGGTYNGMFKVLHIASPMSFDIQTVITPSLGTGGIAVGTSYLPAVRIDNPAYPADDTLPATVIMPTFVGDGEINVINLPLSAAFNAGDRVIFRKDTSDGSYNSPIADYDTILQGGNLAYSTATGVAPEDINVDGDDFVTPTNSHAPEEIVPGQVMDTLAIKVYHRPVGGCPNIMFKNYTADGTTASFNIGQYFPNNSSVIVKLDDTVLELDVNYSINYQLNTVNLFLTPDVGAKVSIVSISFGSASMLDLDYFVADGITKEFITKANWIPTLSATVLVNGNVVTYELFGTNDEYIDVPGQTWRSRVGIRFVEAPPAGAIVNYIIDAADITQTASVVRNEILTYGTGQTYTLSNTLGESIPYDPNLLVKQGQTILKPTSANYFTMSNLKLDYSLPDYKYAHLGVVPADIRVYRDSTLLDLGSDYDIEFDYTGSSYSAIESSIVITNPGQDYAVGDQLDAVGGTELGNLTRFSVSEVGANGEIVAVDLVDVGEYNVPPTSPFELVYIASSTGIGTDATISVDYNLISVTPAITVNVTPVGYKENSKLTVLVDKEADYIVNGQTITFNNVYSEGTKFEIISFYNHNILGIERTVDSLVPTSTILPGTTEYFELSSKLGGIFKLRQTAVSGDFVWIIKNGKLLMNNVDYILMDDFTTVKLSNFLLDTDEVQVIAFTNTVVDDVFGYMQFKDILNRVHYKRLNKNKATTLVKALNQLDKEIEVVNAEVLDNPSPGMNIPGIIEINGERIEYFVKSGNKLSQLRRGTLGTGVPTTHAVKSVVQGLGASETIPYKDKVVVDSFTSDGINNEFTLSYNFNGVSLEPHQDYSDFMEVFIGGQRLKKNEYTIYANTDYPYSPEGDVVLPAEFSFTGDFKLALPTAPALGVKLVVVKKELTLWNDPGKRLSNSTTSISKFVTAVEAVWPEATFRE